MKEAQHIEFKRQWKDKLMGKHESIPYNPEIAKCFFLAGLIEAWGRGIERITEACKQDGYPMPEWKVEPNGVWVVFEFEPEEQPQETGVDERLRSIAVVQQLKKKHHEI